MASSLVAAIIGAYGACGNGKRTEPDAGSTLAPEGDLGGGGKNLYLLGLRRQRLEYPALKRAVREQQSLFRATEVLIRTRLPAPS